MQTELLLTQPQASFLSIHASTSPSYFGSYSHLASRENEKSDSDNIDGSRISLRRAMLGCETGSSVEVVVAGERRRRQVVVGGRQPVYSL